MVSIKGKYRFRTFSYQAWPRTGQTQPRGQLILEFLITEARAILLPAHPLSFSESKTTYFGRSPSRSSMLLLWDANSNSGQIHTQTLWPVTQPSWSLLHNSKTSILCCGSDENRTVLQQSNHQFCFCQPKCYRDQAALPAAQPASWLLL